MLLSVSVVMVGVDADAMGVLSGCVAVADVKLGDWVPVVGVVP